MSFTFDETIAFWDYIKMLQRSLYSIVQHSLKCYFIIIMITLIIVLY